MSEICVLCGNKEIAENYQLSGNPVCVDCVCHELFHPAWKIKVKAPSTSNTGEKG